MRRKILIRTIAAIALLVSCLCLLKSDKAYAAIMSDANLYKLSIMRGVRTCYTIYANSEILLTDFEENPNYTTVFSTGLGSGWGKSSSSDVWITTGVGNELANFSSRKRSNLSCEQTFNGYTQDAQGFKDYYNFPKDLEGYGYEKSGASGGGGNSGTKILENAAEITLLSVSEGGGLKTGVTVGNTKDNSIIDNSLICTAEKSHTDSSLFGLISEQYTWQVTGCNGKMVINYEGKNLLTIVARGEYTISAITTDYHDILDDSVGLDGRAADLRNDLYGPIYSESNDIGIYDAFKQSNFAADLEELIKDSVHYVAGYSNSVVTLYYGPVSEKQNEEKEESANTVYKPKESKKEVAARIMWNKVGFDTNLPYKDTGGYGKEYIWNTPAIYSLYYRYLIKMKEKNPDMTIRSDCSSIKPTDLKYAFKNSKDKWCGIEMTESVLNSLKNTTVSIVKGDDLKEGTMFDALEWLNNESNYKNLKDDQYADGVISDEGIVIPGEEGGGDSEEEVEPTCANSGGADKLGWIICPVMEWAIDASKKMYDQYIEPALQVDPILFTGGESSDNTAKSAWNIFRNIANILFAILFLVVIFSQLTGVGIDNYGIKKILPKLILTALLVNLSYYICMVCVDLSNIFGNGLQSILDGMAKGMTISIDGKTPGDAGVGATAISAVAILATLGIVGVAIWANPAILLPLVISAIGVVIAILFLFVLLSARQAAILMLTVVSPIAFACYMLPNTKKLFDKWLKIGEGLLLVYPICGIMVGGGNFASKLLMTTSAAGGSESNGFFQAFTAMLIGIAPIFFIPSTLKGAFAALGSLGAKISGFGDKLRGGATRAARSSDIYKNAQRMGAERKAQVRNRWKSGTDKNGVLTKRGERKAAFAKKKIGRFLGADKRQARYYAAANKDVAAREEANAALTNALSKSGIANNEEGAMGYYSDAFNKAAAKGDIGGMNAALAAASSSGYMLDKEIAQMVRNALKSANFKDDASRAAWMRNTASKYGNGFLAKDFEMKHWMRKGGAGNLGDYGDYARENIKREDFSAEDVAKMSGSSLAAMASAGLISSGMAKQVLSSGAGLKEDKKVMLGALANGARVSAGENGVDEFKREVTEALNNETADATIGGQTFTGAQRQSWTAPRPMEVRIAPQEGGGASAVPAARTGIAQEGQSFDVHGGNGGGADPAWNNYNVTPEMRDELISQGFTPGDTEIDQYRRR